MSRLRGFESRRRSREFVRLVAEGAPAAEAAREAGVSPTAALKLLDDRLLWQVFVATRRGVAAA